ncbi:MAG: 16S rRNA (cytosine(1402)-N(4))-methyltransferase RsmH [Candidatus Cloacimonetes bacterium]|nr:16S rRNA (cytosine(1402)-N(4))-methyltransferase RsmH [Candidatus Cloacimonadota bacterium]
MSDYHIPVLLEESITGLSLEPGKVIVDGTLGGGGHSHEILRSCKGIRLYSFDQDIDAIRQASYLLDEFPGQITIIHDNFVNIRTRLALERVKKVDGILLDLGISSYQIDQAEKGFSYMQDGNLDMRMDQSRQITAAIIVNTYSEAELIRIFREYGEEKESFRIARAICRERESKNLETTLELAAIIDKAARSHRKIKARSRIFQALRIEVNSELEYLKRALKDAVNLLNPQGRLVVLSYNSLEDRIVKNVFNYEALSCVCPVNFPKCICNKVVRLKVLNSITAGEADEENVRSRSVRMRIAERTALQGG